MNTHEQLRGAVTNIIWLPFEAGKRLQMSDDYTIEFGDGKHLPVFLSGADLEAYRETNKITINSHSILMGALLGYNQEIFGIPYPEQEREFLADMIRQLAIRVFRKDDLGGTLLGAAHWLRENVGLPHGRTALKTAMQLAPFIMAIRIDYICMCWYQAEDESDKNTRHNLLEEIVASYQRFSLNDLPKFFLERTSYFFCSALGILGRRTLPGDREWYDHTFRYINHPFPLGKLEQCQREGFCMEVCRTSSVGENLQTPNQRLAASHDITEEAK